MGFKNKSAKSLIVCSDAVGCKNESEPAKSDNSEERFKYIHNPIMSSLQKYLTKKCLLNLFYDQKSLAQQINKSTNLP